MSVRWDMCFVIFNPNYFASPVSFSSREPILTHGVEKTGEGKCYSLWVQLMPLSYCQLIWPVSAGSQLSHRLVQAHKTCWCSKQEMTPYCQPLFHLNCAFPLWQMDYIQNMGVSRWRQYLNLHKHTLYWKLHPPVSKCLLIFYLLGKSRDSCFIQCHL